MINKRLIFQLSLFGLAMAFATVYIIPSKIEPLFWLVIFIFCAYIISKKCSGRYFLHGLYVSLLNALWIISVHILLFKTYIINHPEEAAMINKMPMSDSPRLMMLITGILIGFISGFVLGLFSFIASRITKKA